MVFCALTEADYPMLLWAVVIALMAAGPALKGWVDVVRWFKGEQLDTSKLCTKEELSAAVAQSRTELKDAETRIQSRQEQALSTFGHRLAKIEEGVQDFRRDIRELSTEIKSLHRSLGQAEGELEMVSKKVR